MKLKRQPDLILGVDPSQRHNALAVYDVDADAFAVASFGPIEEIARFRELQELAAGAKGLAVLALIECPTWSGRGTREVRSAALVWEREISRLFRVRQVFRVDPRVWQSALLGRVSDTKAAALLRVQRAMGVQVTDDHEADAVCIADYGRMLARGVVA